jgi:hypothetical protein
MALYTTVTFVLFLVSVYGLATSNVLLVGLAFAGYYLNDYLVKE